MKNSFKAYLTPEIMKDVMKMESAEELVKYAAERNIKIEESEAEELMKKLTASNDGSLVELADDELDKVAGGEQCIPSSQRKKTR